MFGTIQVVFLNDFLNIYVYFNSDWIDSISMMIDKLCTKTFLKSVISNKRTDSFNKFEILLMYIQKHLQSYLYLLTYFKIIVDEDAKISVVDTILSNDLKHIYFEEIITDIINQYVIISKRILVFIW